MKVTVLIDNIEDNNCFSEWGLSFYIEYKDQKILLDTGGSDKFFINANKLNIDLKKVDYAVLSHAHYDHGDGIETFFSINDKAPFYIQKTAKENCYVKELHNTRYIGIKQGIMVRYKDRFILTSEKEKIAEGVYLLGHSTQNLEKIGIKEHMYLKEGNSYIPDNFSHEQSLVIKLKEGLVVFNSCSHGGFLNIVKEVNKEFPNEKILAYFGGLHLFNKKDEEVKKISEEILSSNINKIYTGHCTGDKAYQIMKDRLFDEIEQFTCGAVYEFVD